MYKKKVSLLLVCAAATFATGAVFADEDAEEGKLIVLTADQLDNVTAGGNLLPNGKEVLRISTTRRQATFTLDWYKPFSIIPTLKRKQRGRRTPILPLLIV